MMRALSYVAIFQCKDGSVITRGKRFVISNGLYAYVGSCGHACAARIIRHLNKVANRFWHVDYLHDICNEVAVMVLPFKEDDVAKALLSRFSGILGFGNSDKKENKTHLFRIGPSNEDITKALHVLNVVIHETLNSKARNFKY
ncbi:MAG: GIY-YIG nuclease family protein [Vulcanisaeta sp.]